MHVDHVGIERRVEDLPALPGVDAKPAIGRNVGALLDSERDSIT
jgi:hypothetical protein